MNTLTTGMSEGSQAVVAQVEASVRKPHELISTAVHLTGLAEVLYDALTNAQDGDEIRGAAANIGWGYEALAELAKKLADEIIDYAD